MKKNIVTIGGGTGTFTVLTGLKHYCDTINLVSIVTVADNGGSTGRLIDHFGILPVGDVRQALVALSDNPEEERLMRELFLYRFEKGEDGLKGHNLGNLLLVALKDITGSEARAIEAASKILDVRGIVLPVSEYRATLVAEYEDQSKKRGEAVIDALPKDSHAPRLTRVMLESKVPLYDKARDAILSANSIIFGPGDLYTSIIPNILVDGFSEAVQQSSAQCIYVANLMTKHGQTNELSIAGHVSELENYLGKNIDTVIINDETIPEELAVAYAKEFESSVSDDYTGKAVRGPMLRAAPPRSQADAVRRSLVRHDPDKLAHAIISII
jgi:uncharacterized cofD-like protein